MGKVGNLHILYVRTVTLGREPLNVAVVHAEQGN